MKRIKMRIETKWVHDVPHASSAIEQRKRVPRNEQQSKAIDRYQRCTNDYSRVPEVRPVYGRQRETGPDGDPEG